LFHFNGVSPVLGVNMVCDSKFIEKGTLVEITVSQPQPSSRSARLPFPVGMRLYVFGNDEDADGNISYSLTLDQTLLDGRTPSAFDEKKAEEDPFHHLTPAKSWSGVHSGYSRESILVIPR
jgi:hypothetical protein